MIDVWPWTEAQPQFQEQGHALKLNCKFTELIFKRIVVKTLTRSLTRVISLLYRNQTPEVYFLGISWFDIYVIIRLHGIQGVTCSEFEIRTESIQDMKF